MPPPLTFCSVIFPDRVSETNALLLAHSIRAFGGRQAGAPIWLASPGGGQGLSTACLKALQAMEVRILPFAVDPAQAQFFFIPQLAGLAQAEATLNREGGGILAWMDANTIVVAEPGELMLPEERSLGYRPVHHLLLGSRMDHPLDPFWEQIYQACSVQAERVFPMRPVVEELQMRPYFNAGLLAARPGRGLFTSWQKTFNDLYRRANFQDFYRQDGRYAIFMHQAVLAGVTLRELPLDELIELPERYNYPAHLWEKDPTDRRPANLDELVTFRHEGFYQEEGWAGRMPAGPGLKRWLAERLAEIGWR